MAAHAVYDCSSFILTHALIHQHKSRDPERLKRGKTHLQYVHVYVFTHKHTYSPGRGRLFVDPRGRGASVPKQLIQRLRIWGWEERERERERERGVGWGDGQMRKRWGWKEIQSLAINTGVFSPQTEERITRDIGQNWPGQIKLSQRPTVTPPHLSWERKRATYRATPQYRQKHE